MSPLKISITHIDAALSANNSVEILSAPLILEATDILKATISSTDSIHINLSYLIIT